MFNISVETWIRPHPKDYESLLFFEDLEKNYWIIVGKRQKEIYNHCLLFEIIKKEKQRQ